MRNLLALAVIAIVAIGCLAWTKLRTDQRPEWVATAPYSTAITDIPRVLAALPVDRSAPVFAVFIFNPPGHSSDDDAVNIQFSAEDGKRGFDWVLLGRTNVNDQKRYVAFAQSAGYHPALEELNGVKYWRVEQGDLSRLCEAVITRMYQHPAGEPVDMIVQGFDWKP